MGGCVTKDQAISRARCLDLVYSQYGMLYEMFPDAPRPFSDLPSLKSPDVPPFDGTIGSVSQTSTKYYLKQKYVSDTVSCHHSKNPLNSSKTFKVNFVQSIMADKASKVKKKGNFKAKFDTQK